MKKTLWGVPLVLAFGSLFCLGQATNSGDIRGSVTDTTGALIPGVTVTVLDVATGVSKAVTTNDAGLYDTNSIVTGSYTVTFKKDGFETLVRGPVSVEVGLTTVNGELKVGAASQEVTVSADVPLLKTETSDQSTTMEAKSMAQLPQVAGGPGVSWENFMILLPGATGNSDASQGSSNPGQEVAINGNLPYSNILADGASTTLSHSQNANPAIFETVAELQVSSSSFSAQYGIGGVIFNQISKGGTNQFHGSAYDYFQNDALTAQPYLFGNKPTPIPFLRYNDFGFSFGGPVLKKKMFFFFAYDQVVNHGNSTSNPPNSVPTVAVMGGDFTGMQTIYDPTTQTIGIDSKGNPYPIRQSFASEYGNGNAIPSALFDTVAAAEQQFYPTPTNHIAGGTFVNGNIGAEGVLGQNFYASLQASQPYRKFFGRLDYDINPKNRLTMSDTQSDTPQEYPNLVSACPIGCQSGDVDNNNAQITDVWNISPTMVNEARIGFTSQLNFFKDKALNQGYAAKLGWQFAKADDFPAINFYNTFPYAWLDPSSNSVYKEFTWDPSDVVTMIRGKHILHFGGELLAYQNNSTAWGNTNAGTFNFTGQYTQQWALDSNGVAAPVAGTGMEYADFLLGYANQWSAGISPEYGARLKSPQIFVQDDWKIRPNLTLNLGLRYQINHGWNEVHNNMSSFDPNVTNTDGTLGAYWFGTTHANGRTSLQANTYNTVQPRVGFAWAYNPKTTLRGGFGLYSYTWSLDTYGGNNTAFGMGSAVSSSGALSDDTNGITPVTKLDGPGTQFGTSTALPFVAGSTSPDAFNGQPVGYVQYHTPVPRIAQWNLSVQRALTTDFVAELAYVGSHGSKLNFPTDLNQVPQSKWSSNDAAERPFPNFQCICDSVSSTNNAISNYNSLQASITKRMTHGLSLSFNYVWAHMLDDQDSSGWGGRGGNQYFQNASDPGANYSNSNFDVRHAFKGYAVYELPFGKGKPFLNGNRLVDEAVGGWQLAGTVILQTGNPFSLRSSQANYSLAGSTFPNRVPGVDPYAGGRSRNNWFNLAAFSEPADGTWGDVRRNALYGPGINEFNLSAGKAFHIPYREGMQVEFRADAQNVFNHPSFGTPGNINLSANSGVAFSGTAPLTSLTVQGRNLQLALRVTF